MWNSEVIPTLSAPRSLLYLLLNIYLTKTDVLGVRIYKNYIQHFFNGSNCISFIRYIIEPQITLLN